MSDIEILVREARELDAEIRELTEKKVALVERIKAELKPGDFVVVDGVRASMREGNRKFDLATALKMLPEDLKLKCVVTCIDEKLVREAAEAVGVLAAAMIRPDDAKPVLDLVK
jgi:hypothetical protein